MTRERPLPPIAAEKLDAMAQAVLDAHANAREPVTRAGLYRDRLGVLLRFPPRERERVIVRVMEMVERPAGGDGAGAPGARWAPPAVPEPAVTAALAPDSRRSNNPVTAAAPRARNRKPRTDHDRANRPRATAKRQLSAAQIGVMRAAIRCALTLLPEATSPQIRAMANGDVPAALGPKALQKHAAAVRKDMGIVAARSRPGLVVE